VSDPHSGAPEVDVAPFDLGGPDAAVGALCLHGLTGTPYEVRRLGEALAAAGVHAVGPTLPGHAASPAELARLPYTAWLESVRSELGALRDRHERVLVVGLSLGGLLALLLAAEEPVDGLAVIGTPLRLPRAARWLVPVLKYPMPYLRKRGGSDVRDEAARRRHPSYPVMPLASVHQLIQLQGRVRRALPRVTAPLLVAHGLHDRTAHPDDARTILGSVGSEVRELLWLEDSGHVVPVDFGGPRLAEAVVAHLSRLA
jgi:carboxylesterase